MKKIKLTDVFKCSPDMIFINAGYRRKILSKWVMLNEVVYKDPKEAVKDIFKQLHLLGRKFDNPDLTHWHERIMRQPQGSCMQPPEPWPTITPKKIAEMSIEAIDNALKLPRDTCKRINRTIKAVHLTGEFTYKKDNKCPHCEFLNSIFLPISNLEDRTNREYWLYTEVFVYLHGGKDYCNWEEEPSIDPDKVIEREGDMIKENQSKPRNSKGKKK